MSDEIDQSTGAPAFVYDGNEGEAWHKLGNAIPKNIANDPAKIAELAQANYKVFAEPTHVLRDGKPVVIKNRVAITRGDTGEVMEVLSGNRYNIVQPIEYFEAFRDALAANDLVISSAGVLKGGRIVFVNARLGDELATTVGSEEGKVDRVVRYLCMGGGYNGEMSSFGYASDMRTVCWNTLSANLAISRDGRGLFKVPHSSIFDGKLLGAALGMLGPELKIRSEVFNKLARTKLTLDQVRLFIAAAAGVDLGTDAQKAYDTLSVKKRAKMDAMMVSYRTGPGADLPSAKGTLWGALNAVTHYVDHLAGTRDTTEDGSGPSRYASAQFGTGADTKRKALLEAMSLAGITRKELVAA